MDPIQQTPQQPIEPTLHWRERLIHWSGWEKMVEYRRQLIGITLCLIAVIWLFGWWFARQQSSSVADTLRAEMIVQRLRNPLSTPDASKIAVDSELQHLAELAPVKSPLAARFSGMIAQEEVLQDVHPLSEERFSIASDNLIQAQLPLNSALVKATQLSSDGKIDEALHQIEEILSQSKNVLPQVYGYALLQKATLLRQQKMSNGMVLSELENFLSSHPDVEAAFDHVFSGKTNEALSFLKID